MNQPILHRYMETLSRLAESEDYGTSARMAAAIIYKNRLVSVGTNSMKTHPFQAKYGKNGDAIFLHAEISAIKNATRHLSVDQFQNSTLLICRVKRPGAQSNHFIPGLAKPCSGCMRAIADFRIYKVIYTNETGEYTIL